MLLLLLLLLLLLHLGRRWQPKAWWFRPLQPSHACPTNTGPGVRTLALPRATAALCA